MACFNTKQCGGYTRSIPWRQGMIEDPCHIVSTARLARDGPTTYSQEERTESYFPVDTSPLCQHINLKAARNQGQVSHWRSSMINSVISRKTKLWGKYIFIFPHGNKQQHFQWNKWYQEAFLSFFSPELARVGSSPFYSSTMENGGLSGPLISLLERPRTTTYVSWVGPWSKSSW